MQLPSIRRRLWIFAGGVAALFVLFPPWQKTNGDSLGYGPLFSPPRYTVMMGNIRMGREPVHGVGGRVIDPGRPWEYPDFIDQTAVIAWGRLITQLAALGVIAGVLAGVTRPDRARDP